MAQATLDQKLLRNLPPVPPGKTKLRLHDSVVRGFYVEISAIGTAVFWVRYTSKTGQRRDFRIGRLGEISLDQARQQAHAVRCAAASGDDPAAQRDRKRKMLTLGEFIDQHYLPAMKGQLRSYEHVETIARLRVVPALGQQRLDSISRQDVARFKRDLMCAGLSNSRVNAHLSFVRRAYNLAGEWGYYEGPNPAQAPKMLPVQAREEVLTSQQIGALLDALGAEPERDVAIAIAVLALTGARKSEILRARWCDVDIERRHLIVPLSKNGRRRTVMLPVGAIELLCELPRAPGQEWVFPSPIKPEQPRQGLRRCWERVKKRAGLPDQIRPHDMRHSFASLLVNENVSLQIVQHLLGHSRPGTTAAYAHLAKDRLLEAADLVGTIVMRAGETAETRVPANKNEELASAA